MAAPIVIVLCAIGALAENGRMFDLEIDFDSRVIGRQRMIFDWTPRKYYDDVSRARTFGFVRDAKILRQAGYALGSSMDNSITVHEDRILNPGGLRYFRNPEPVRQIALVTHRSFIKRKLLELLAESIRKAVPKELLEDGKKEVVGI